ncbi:MAG: Dodecin [Deltaproteobacteria bacterium]|nr:Dodecin [Deltaproteobacteria bacterium]
MSVYIINEIVGTSDKSWEDAAKQAIETARLTISFGYHPWWSWIED